MKLLNELEQVKRERERYLKFYEYQRHEVNLKQQAIDQEGRKVFCDKYKYKLLILELDKAVELRDFLRELITEIEAIRDNLSTEKPFNE